VILAPGGGKLSKRHGAAAVSEYRAMGYLPEALLNFLALLGWAISGDKEVLPLSEMIGHFTLEAINKTGAQFNREKLDWMNGVYLRQLPLERLTELVRPWLEREGLLASDTPADRLACAMRLAQERMQLLPDAIEHSYCFLAEEPRYDEHAVRKFLGKAGVREHLAAVGALLAAVPDGDFLPPRLAEVLMGYLATSGQSLKTVVHPLRVAVTGRAASPGIFETLSCIGKTRVLRRITHAVETLCHAH
jgi:glutamyl-tRNA synthetase